MVSYDKFVPIISNHVHNDAIFGEEEPGGRAESSPYVIHEALAIEWATKLTYPMAEKHRLARVAQYNLVVRENLPLAKTDYLDFINLSSGIHF